MLSQEFLIQRGYCCGHGCLMCPYEPKHIKDNTIMAKQMDDIMYDECVVCNEQTRYDKETHVDFRIGYIEGAGQLCLNCYDNIYVKKNKNLYKDNKDGTFQKFTDNFTD